MIELTFTQCKQISAQHDLRYILGSMNSQPTWITQELDIADIQAVIQGGCASGAYMPAVLYYNALQTMTEHGDDVLDYLAEHYGVIPGPIEGESYSGMAVFYLSCAVEAWCDQFIQALNDVNWD